MDIATDQPVLPPLRRLEFDDYIRSILERELRLTLYGVQVGSSRDDSMRELTEVAASLYEERVLIELIQNAYDGSGEIKEAEILVRIDLQAGKHGTVYVANNGAAFTESDVDSIVNPALSNKRPGKAIGHKGLGFRGVALISDYPRIYSMDGSGRPGARWFDGFCFGFANPEDERTCLDRLGAGSLLEGVIGKTHRLQLPVPLPHEQPSDILRFANEGYATVVCLPLRDGPAAARAVDEWDALFSEAAPLVLFLDRVRSLSLECIHADGKVERRSLKRQRKPVLAYPSQPSLSVEEVAVDRHRYLLARSDVDRDRFLAAIEQSLDDRSQLKKWKEWEGQPEVRIAMPITAEAREGKYYAFLPTTKPAPFYGFLDAPFFPNPDRLDISLRLPLNSMLLDAVAETCARLALTFAKQDERSSEFAVAALDAIAWAAERSRLFAAFKNHGTDSKDIPVPIARRREMGTRWSTLEEVFIWDDEEFVLITGDWLARICEVPMLRRGIGEKRLAAITNLASAANIGLRPAATNWRIWAPKLVADLVKRKKPKRVWEELYIDLAKIPDALPHLKGAQIFRSDEGKIVPANSGPTSTTAERPEVFVVPTSTERHRKRRKIGETGLFPPKSVVRNMIFVDPTLHWRQDVLSAYVKAGLANEYSLSHVVARLGRLVGRRPPRLRVLAALGWAFTVWKTHRGQVEDALKHANLLLPIKGGTLSASRAFFGEGWRNTQGDTLAELCAAASENSRELRQLGDRILPRWEDWPLKERGTAVEWTQFLRALNVKDGLLPACEEVTLDRWQWSALTYPGGQPIRIERSTGPYWRNELQDRPQESFRYQSGTYRSGETLVWLHGQSNFDEVPVRAKLAYAQLVIHFLEDNQDNYLTTRLTRSGGNYDYVDWTSPIMAFLRGSKWIPIQGDADISWVKPCDAWFAPRSEYIPPFVSRIDRSIRDLIDRSKGLSEFMASQIGLQIWSSSGTSAGRIALLGRCLSNGIGEAERETFRKAYREAWQDWERLGPERPPLTSGLIIPVDVSGRLTALPDDGDRIVYISDDSNPMRHQLVAALDEPVFVAPTDMAQTCADALALVRRDEFKLLTDAELQVEAGGSVFEPSANAELLVAPGREWLAEISALVLELRTSLTNRNTDRARQGLYQSLKRVRVKFVDTIAVTLGSKRVALPSSLQHVLPVAHPQFPTLLVEGADALSWPLLASMATGLALIIQQPSLAQPFKLAFLEIAWRGPTGVFERPDDETVALAVEQPVHRVRELYRSLRSTSQHLLNVLVPVVYLRHSPAVATELRNEGDLLIEESDVVRWLYKHGGISLEGAGALVSGCRDAESLDDARRAFSFDLPTFNSVLQALGEPWQPLRFEIQLRQSFKDRIGEKQSQIQQRIRDAYFGIYDKDGSLDGYLNDLTLGWISFPPEWIDLYADLSDDLIDQFVDQKISEKLPNTGGQAGEPLEAIRRRNRAELVRCATEYRRIVKAWCAKDQTSRVAPNCWSETTEQLAREAIASGYLDFRILSGDGLISALAGANLWPANMPRSTTLSLLGLSDEDLQEEERQEERRRQATLKAKRSISFDGVEIDGGEDGCFQKVANALEGAFGSEGFKRRSGVANLETFRSRSRNGSGGGGTRTRDPTYLTEEQRSLIGFAGELAAYHYLRQHVQGFADESWLSSIGRRYLGLPPTGDDDGFDFSILRSRGPLCYEVKSHLGDPGYVDLERSQVAAAVRMAAERRGRWRILYVANAGDPGSITVLELPNPYSDQGKALFRDERTQGVRLRIKRGD